MADYFTDEDEATRGLIDQCIEPLDKDVRLEYLINCLVLRCRANQTVKEIFQSELKAMKDIQRK